MKSRLFVVPDGADGSGTANQEIQRMPTQDTAIESVVDSNYDSILSNASLPHRATFFPLGFPLEIATNSPTILAAAQQSWGLTSQRFAAPPLKLYLGVASDADASTLLPPAPVCRARGHLMSSIADPYNFVQSDLNEGFSFGWITPVTVEASLYLRYFFLEAAALGMLCASRVAPIHAACVSVDGHGMLLCGDSGAGKSSLAFAGARAGWTYTCDDASYLPLDGEDRMVVGNCHQIRFRDSGPLLFPELQGRPITPRAAGKPSIEVPTAEMPGLLTAESAIVKSIIFLNRREVRVPELVPYSRETASSWLSDCLFANSAVRAAQRLAIDQLTEVPIFELRYNDLEWAIERLTTLATRGN
jgi:hypothetical protein